jgi:hypothetical protein
VTGREQPALQCGAAQGVVREEDVDLAGGIVLVDEGQSFVVRGELLRPPGLPRDPVVAVGRPSSGEEPSWADGCCEPCRSGQDHDTADSAGAVGLGLMRVDEVVVLVVLEDDEEVEAHGFQHQVQCGDALELVCGTTPEKPEVAAPDDAGHIVLFERDDGLHLERKVAVGVSDQS